MSKKSVLTNCEFCCEFNEVNPSRFHLLYGSQLSSRIIATSQNFVAVPTIGQLFRGSLLVLPKSHFENFAELPTILHAEALRLMEYLQARLAPYGKCLNFEHGATKSSEGGCGIYHAHFHLIPLPTDTNYEELTGSAVMSAETLADAWGALKDCSEYLVVQDTFGDIVYSVPYGNDGRFESQYCRRRLSEYFGLRRPWDWRAYDKIEPWLLSTVNELRDQMNSDNKFEGEIT